MSGNTAATLALGVSTGRAASDLLELTTALKSFKSALVEFNQQKAQNPLANLKGSTAEAVASLKTQLAEVETANKKLTESLKKEEAKRLQDMNQHSLMQSAELVKRGETNRKIMLKSAEMTGAAIIKEHERTARESAKALAAAVSAVPQLRATPATVKSSVGALVTDHSGAAGLREYYGQLERNYKLLGAVKTLEASNSTAGGGAWLNRINQIGQTNSALTQLGDHYRKLEVSSQPAVKVVKDHAKATKEASDWTYTHARAMNDAHSAARGLASGFGAMWLTWGNIVPLLAGAAISNGIVQATKAGSEFAYQLTFVKALGDETAMTMGLVGEKVREISKSGLQGPVELANGLRMLAQAGLTAQESIQALPHVMHLATVGEMTMAEAGITLAGVMNAFRLKIDNFEHIGDVFAKAAAVSQTSVEQMTQAMKTASVVGEQYGATMEDTATALTLLARVNITGTAAGTSLRNMLKELYTPMDGVKKVMQQIGLQAVDSKGNLKPFADVIYDLRGKLEQFDKASQTNILQKLFGERGAKEAIAMLSQTREEWDKLRNTISDSQGFAAKVSKQLEDSAKGQFKQALNTLQATMIEAFEGAEQPMKEFAQALKELAGSPGLVNALRTTLEAVATLARMVVQALPALVELVKVMGTFFVISKAVQFAASGYTALAGAFLSLSGAMGPVAPLAAGLAPRLIGLVSPLGLIAAGLTIGVTLWNSWGSAAADAMRKATAGAKTTVADLQETMRDLQHAPGMQSAEAAQQATYNSRKKLGQLNDQLIAARSGIMASSGLKAIDLTGDFDADAAESKSYGNARIRRDLVALKELQREYDAAQKIVQQMSAESQSRTSLATVTVGGKMGTGSKVFSTPDRDLGAQISAEKTGITDLFNHAEKSAKAQYDHEVTLANDLLAKKLIGEEGFTALRERAEEGYILKVYTAREAAEAGIAELQSKADKESQQRQLENASQRIGFRIQEQAEQDKLNQKTKLSLAGNAALADANGVDKTLTKLNAEAEKDRFAKLAGEYAKTLSSEDQAALTARVQETNRYASAIAEVNDKYEDSINRFGAASPAAQAYYVQLEALKGAQEENVGAAENLARALDKTHRSMSYGAQEAFAAYINGATNAAEQSKQVWSAALQGIEGEFAKFIRTGKADWRSFANVILDQLARIAAAKMVAGIAGAVMGAFGGSSRADLEVAQTQYQYDALGGAYQPGGRVAFAKGGAFTNAIVSSPTLFRFAQGGAFRQGVMGEAGPEAVMPLERDSQGRLGVKASGATQGNTFQVNISVDAKGTKSEGNAGAANDLAKKLEGEMKRILVNEMRPGGLLENV